MLMLLAACSVHPLNAKQNIDLRDLTSGQYSTERLGGVEPLLDGESYAQISPDNRQILKYSFRTGAKTATLFDVATARKVKLDKIDGYILSPDESRILIQTETKKIYRRSFTAVYYIYTVANNTLEPLSDGGPQQVPLFSPDGNQVAFVRGNNLFLVKLLFNNSESQITKDGKTNAILNGLPDWVNEEEFTTNRSFDFSADSKMLAWIRYDETNVPTFSFPLYKGMEPSMDEYAEYPGEYSYKYPMAGAQNSKVSVLTYDIKAHQTRQMKLPLDSDGYIPRIKFTSDPAKLSIVTLNRHQDRMDLYMGNPRSTVCQLILRDNVDKYVEETEYENIQFYKDHFLLMSDRDGYNHIYLYNMSGQLVKQLTKGNFPVTNFYGYDEKEGVCYFGSNQESPLRTAVYRTDLKGKTVKLSAREGQNSAIFSTNLKYFINIYSNLTTPPVYSLCENNGKELKVMIDNKKLQAKVDAVNMGTKELFSFRTSEGVTLNGWMIKPADFSPSKKYPVVMFQYSGPGNQQVIDGWGIGDMGGGLYESYLAQQGFISVCVDGRGTGGRGAAFEKCTYLNLGDLESKDQVETAIYLGSLPYVDKDNIGIWGWSYGGFCTLMSMSEGRGVFKCGVAVAPPTCYRFYDSVYTERYMRTPKENSTGYNRNPITRANQLHGNLLICHGLADDNVHFRNTAEYSEALVQADKQFEMAVYTNRNHGIMGGNTRNHLFTRITNFFNRNLK